MPYVILKTKEGFFAPVGKGVARTNHPLGIFTKHLTALVADALTIPGHELNSSEVEVEVHEFGEFDVVQADVEIIVFANHYAERADNLEERRKRLEHNVIAWLMRERASRGSNVRSMIKKISIWMPLVMGGAYGEVELQD
jgi:hypothetical protein